MKHVWEEHYPITSFLVNLRGQAGLYSVLNFIQDVGWQHAFNSKVSLPKGRGWIFTRQKLTMNRWPHWNEKVTVKTWLRPPASDIFLLRDYEIYIGEEKIGECTSTFSVMDMEKRKIAIQDWSEFSAIWREDFQLSHQPQKIVIPENMQELAQFQVRNSDIDLNQHVNNTKYAQWVLDALPIEVLKKGAELKEYEVNFLAETKIGDIVSVLTSEERPEDDLFVIQFQGLRQSDKKPVFTAQMKVKRSP